MKTIVHYVLIALAILVGSGSIALLSYFPGIGPAFPSLAIGCPW